VIALALVLVGQSLPHALLAPAAGVLADRLDRRRMLIGVNTIQAGLTLAMAMAAAGGSLPLVQVMLFVRACVGAFLPPVQSSAMRRVVEEDELLPANALLSVTWSVMFAVGTAAGGAIAALGPVLALVLDAASFGVAALLLRRLPPMPAADAERAGQGALAALAAVRRDMAAAWRLARERPPLLEAVLAKSPVAFAGGGAWVLLNLVADRIPFAGSGAVTLGLLQCVRGIGTGVGPVIADAMVRRGMPSGHAARIAVWTYFAGIVMLSGVGHWAALLVAALAWGMGGGGNWVLSSAAIQRLSPESFVGRLSAIDNLAWTTAMCLAALGGAALVDRTGAHGASAWLGLAVGAGAWAGARWTIARRQATAPAAERLTHLHREASDTLSPPRSS
jgi:MFS family permease